MKKPTDRQSGKERRQYEKPQVKEYGRLTDLTRVTAPTGMGDGAMSGLTKSVI